MLYDNIESLRWIWLHTLIFCFCMLFNVLFNKNVDIKFSIRALEMSIFHVLLRTAHPSGAHEFTPGF